ncbi:DUF4270 domain-containing protein [Hymenobacter sp. RP-2-7]|uniref:DUF4270 domain-containing protein n=1 Tax=Hymenobacter polaris TaxID=2682546 RepID=A0A7Y0FMC7_9BACT|nr:DUF4270 family protein [Hymenobacter polaris]NML65371.1 DUF4270 domain-containing protein [Hymenobacter polaris]
MALLRTMTFGELTPVQSSSNLTSAWRHLLGLVGLVMLVGACSADITGIGVGLPDANANTGAYLVDTITVRASTVLRDSVPTSTSSYLLAGRYTDPLLGTLEARSFFRVGLSTTFTPDASYLLDSVVLVLKPDTYRYGDTTKTQTLFSIYPMKTPVSNTQVSYASPKYTKADFDSTTLLNEQAAPVRRARPNLTTLRIRLKKSFGQSLLDAGQTGRIATQDEFQAFFPGLAVLPGATDNAALVRMSATSTDAGLFLYYHTAADASTEQNITLQIATGNGHYFQVRANRRTGSVGAALPTQPLQKVSASLTGEQTFVEGALGLQTKLEFPYLSSIRQFGQNLTITNAQITAQVPATSLTPYLPTPPSFNIYLSNANNQPVSTTTYATANYTPGVSTLTGLDQGTYNWTITSYVQAVLANTTPNNGMLLASGTPELPTRVALGSQRSVLNKLQLRLYLISLN